MSISDTVNVMVDNMYAPIKLENEMSMGLLKKAMEVPAMISEELLKMLPETQSLALPGEVGSILDVYA